MSSVEFAIPDGIVPFSPLQHGEWRPVSSVAPEIDGEPLHQDYGQANRSLYQYTPARFGAQSGKLFLWRKFWRDVALGATPFWIPEAFSETHIDVLCGPLANGSRTTFPVSMMAPTINLLVSKANSESVGVYEDPGGYTVWPTANMLTSEQANAVAGTLDGLTAYGSCSLQPEAHRGRQGMRSIRVIPDDGIVTDYGVELTAAGYIAGAQNYEYTQLASIIGIGTFRLTLLWYTAAKALISNQDSGDIAGATNAWADSGLTHTPPDATTAFLNIRVRRTTASAAPFWVSCQQLGHGDYDRFHPPHAAPGVIEMAAAPADGTRLVAESATGVKLSRVRVLRPGEHQWARYRGGIAVAGSFVAREYAEGVTW